MTAGNNLEDMKSEIATDIYQTCLMMRRRVARIVQAKSFQNVDIAGVTELLEIIDYIDKKLEAYKKKYLKLKQRALKEIEKKRTRLEMSEQKVADDKKPQLDKKSDKKQLRQSESKPVQSVMDLLDLGGSS